MGYVIGTDGIKPDSDKVAVIKQLAVPKNLKQLHVFLSMMNYYCKFILQFASIAAPLTKLLAKDAVYK